MSPQDDHDSDDAPPVLGLGIPLQPGPPVHSRPQYHYESPGYNNPGVAEGTYGMSAQDGDSLSAMIPRYLRLFRRKWFIMLSALILGGAIGYYKVSTTTRMYETNSLFEINLRRPRLLKYSGAVIDKTAGSQAAVNTYMEKLRRSSLLAVALEIVRDDAPYLKGEDSELARTLRVRFDIVKHSMLVRITARHTDGNLAAAFANAYAKAAHRTLFEENRADSENAVAWLKTQAVSMRESLEAMDHQLLSLRESSQIEGMESRQKTLLQAVQAIDSQMLDVDTQISLEREVFEILSAEELTPEDLGRLPESALRNRIRESLDAYNAAQTERRALLIRYTDRHPKITAQDTVIRELHQRMTDAMKSTRQSSEANLGLLKRRAETLRAKRVQHDGVLQPLNLQLVEVRMQLAALERKREASDYAYSGILNRIEEARLAADENTASIKIIERARVPEDPVEPRVRRIMTRALLFGLGIGIGLVLVSDMLEDYVWSSSDVERTVGVKILGVTPLMEMAARIPLARICQDRKNSLMSESIAGIRSVISSVYGAENTRSLLVTSTAPKEGKTICACNLAITYARSGHRTLLIDLDLRIPRVARIFKVEADKANLLDALAARDSTSFPTLPMTTDIENLDIIVSHPRTGISPSDLLGGKFIREFIEWAKMNYDQVIIDSPPFGAVSDSGILGSMVDGVVLVVRERRSRRVALQRVVQHFNECGAHVLGVVMNGIRFQGGKYGLYNSYSYHHAEYYNEYRAGELEALGELDESAPAS